jgi:hypothetical protein
MSEPTGKGLHYYLLPKNDPVAALSVLRRGAETSAMAALLAADQLPAPPPLRKALHTVDIHLTETTDQARLLPKTA